MMKKIIIPVVLVIVSSFLVAACSKAAPSCADEKTKKKVIGIALDDFKKKVDKYNEDITVLNEASGEEDGLELMDFEKMKKEMVLEIQNIRTQNYDKNTGRYECAADFSAEYQGDKSTYPITYASELLEGQDDFYVTVQGLSKSK